MVEILNFKQLATVIKTNAMVRNSMSRVILMSHCGSPCGLVVRVPGCRSRGLGSIPGATRFSEKWFWNGVYSASSVQLRSYFKEKVAALV
jgi:hypothetical protein